MRSCVSLRAQGCLLGQLAGDALGSLVEFQSPEDIRCRYPHGLRELSDGGKGDPSRQAKTKQTEAVGTNNTFRFF